MAKGTTFLTKGKNVKKAGKSTTAGSMMCPRCKARGDNNRMVVMVDPKDPNKKNLVCQFCQYTIPYKG